MTPVRRRFAADDADGEDNEGGSLRWMLTYSDMITLLLALFVILYALNQGSPQKLRAVARVLASTYDAHVVVGTAPGPSVIPGASGGLRPGSLRSTYDLNASVGKTVSTQQLHTLAAQIATAIRTGHLAGDAQVHVTPQGILVTLSADYLFSEGHAAISAKGVALIRKIGALLVHVPNPVVVLGATDDLPIHTAQFPSNWQLGAMRAANVSAVLGSVAGFQPQRLLAATTSKYHPIASNTTAAGRASNRRVVIWVVRSHTLVDSLFQGSANGAPAVPISGGGS